MEIDPLLATITVRQLRRLRPSPAGTLVDSCGSETGGDTAKASNADTGPEHDLVARLNAATEAKLAGLAHEPITLGDYVLDRLVGIGGMGRVFAARARGSERSVALKALHRDNARALRSLKQEFRVLAEFNHPNLVDLDALVVDTDGSAFFTMELVEGRDFVVWVRDGLSQLQAADPVRVRSALIQLLSGLEHLHARGYVHRDIKPSNVMVDGDERVVVLDFGLVNEFGVALTEEQVVGTPLYMAPEQVRLETAGPPADLYAVGVVLFECLVGVRPFAGSAVEVMRARCEDPAPDLATIVPDVDPELAALCMELLVQSPELRPSASAVLERLRRSSPRARTTPAPFVGRVAELAALDGALAELHAHRRPIVVLVHGPTGRGKSSLLSRWRASLTTDELVLRGRCHEQESVPYKGLDAIIDALSSDLGRLPADAREALRPAEVDEVVRLFPVLAEVWPKSASPGSALEPAERRERALASLRALFVQLTRMHPVVLMLDDFHWADIDSVALLEQLIDHAEAPAMLVAISYREPPDPGPAVTRLRKLDASSWLELRALGVGPLGLDDAGQLAAVLLRDSTDAEDRQAQILALVSDAAGNPGDLRELALRRNGDGDADPDRVVAARLLALTPACQRALTFVILAGAIEPEALAVAGCLARDIEALLAEELLHREAGKLEVGHERIAKLTVDGLDAQARSDHHLAIARALAQIDANPERLADQFERGGDLEQALVHAERAAEHAMDAFAFHRAASWFERCLAWLPTNADEPSIRRALEGRLTRAYLNAGRLLDGARLLQAQANAAEGATARELRIAAVEYLLKAGHMAEGVREAQTLLAAVDLEMPRGRVQMLFNVLSYRRRVAVDLARLDQQLPATNDPLLHERMRVCEAICSGFTSHDGLVVVHFCHLWRRLAIEIGDRQGCARALALDATFCAAAGWTELGNALMQRAEALAGDDTHTWVWLAALEVHVGLNQACFGPTVAVYDAARPMLEAHPDGAWERYLAAVAAMGVLLYAGDLQRAVALARRELDLAQDLGDLKSARDFSGMLAIALVWLGRVDEAQQVIARIERIERGLIDDHYMFADLFRDFARIHGALRRGSHDEALAIAGRLPANMKRDGLWHVVSFRLEALAVIAMTELRADKRPLGYRKRRRLRGIVRKLQTGSTYQRGNAALIEAALCEQPGAREQAPALLVEAERCFIDAGAKAHLASARWRRAALLGPDAGRQPRTEAEAYFERESIANPQGLVDMLAPGL